MKKLVILAGVAAVAGIAGCVLRTEHKIDAYITLDIRHIENQADTVLDFVEGKRDALPGMEATSRAAFPSWLKEVWDGVNPIQVAHAAESWEETSPLIVQIASSMRARHERIEGLKRQGCLGENNRGYVELRECAAHADPEARNAAQQLLAEENRDRKALYGEVARLNRDQGLSVSTVESVYAGRRLQRGSAGEIFQLPPAGEYFEAFKASPACNRLGDECRPNAWVRLK